MQINRNSERKAVFLACFLIALYLLPLFVLGENAHVRVHDNLDSNIAWYKVLKESGEIFGSVHATIPQVMNGLPRNVFGTEFSLLIWLHALFPSMAAYAISQAIVRYIAFLGMYLLLRDYFVPVKSGWIRIGVALAFSLTPFWPSGMLSTMGHPLALWAFLHIRSHHSSWKHWITIILLPFYSSFVLGFFFFLAAMGLLWGWDALRYKKVNLPFLGGILLMTCLYLLIDYRFVYSLLFSHEPTSRSEFISSRLGLWRTIRLIFKNFALGHGHVMTIHTIIILPLQIFGLALILYKKLWKSEKYFLFFFILNFVLSAWYAFWFHKGWQPLKEAFSLLNTFNFARFHFLRPLVIYVLFALSLSLLWRKINKGAAISKWMIILQVIVLFIFNDEIRYRYFGSPSFREFYAVSLFEKIDRYIGIPKHEYRVASIGFHPAVTQYNGYYTLDTYNNFYPLTYKHKFRRIIAGELEKNKQLKKYFDTWGGRCYLFVDELGKWYEFRKDSKVKIQHLNLDTDSFYEMGGRYIFSTVPVVNAKENQLQLLKSFEDENAPWRVYVYKVIH
jgi:hypothetical protein